MSGITWQALRNADFTAVEDAAALWSTYLQRSADVEDALFTDIEALGGESGDFVGASADALRDNVKRASNVFQQDLTDYAEPIAKRLNAAAEDLKAKQDALADLIAEAGVDLIPTGGLGEEQFTPAVQGPGDFHYLGGSTPAERQEEMLRLVERAEALTDEFRSIMSETREIDDQIAADLRALDDDAPPLPPLISDPDYAEHTADYLAERLDSGDHTPEEVSELWGTLTAEEQQLLLDERPELLGGLDGIPTGIRDEANRGLLNGEINDLSSQLESLTDQADEAFAEGRHEEYAQLTAEIREVEERLGDLENLEQKISGTALTGQDYFLLGYDADDDGRAIVSIGDPDTADNTGVYVPGTGAGLAGVNGLINRAEVMAWESQQADMTEETAVVMWLNYDAPDNPVLDSPSLSYAEDAAPALSSFMSGLEASNHDSEGTTTTVLGHSYGTTVVGETAKEEGLATDQIVAVASPGMNVGSVEDLGIDDEDFYATTNDRDVIQAANWIDFEKNGDWTGLGPDPASEEFGGRSFASDAMTSNPVDAHSTYWDEGNAARQNMGLILTGQGDATR